MPEIAEWEGFYVMAGGAAAVLTGLIFVAVTLHSRSIIESAVHRDRAWSSVAILLSQLIIAMAVLVPHQSVRLLGLEILVVGAFWVVRTVRVTKQLSAAMRRLERSVDYRLEWLAWIAWVVALAAAGLALVAESSLGLSFLALAMAGMFGFAVWSAWVLVSEIPEEV